MRPSHIKSRACLLGLISLLAVIVGCDLFGVNTFFGGGKQTNPTEPCEERVPTATPIPPSPTPLIPTEPVRIPIPVVTITPPPEPPPSGECEGPGQVLICQGEPVGPPIIIIELPEPPPSASEAAPIEEFKSVTINVNEMNLTSLTKMLVRNIKGSDIDIVLSAAKDVFTIDLSEPISSAYLKTSGNTDDVILKAFDKSDNVVDMDISSSELIIYGRGIVKLVLVKADGKIDELSFIPQL